MWILCHTSILISVKPDWNDSTELLGYKNLNDEFISGKLTEIILDRANTIEFSNVNLELLSFKDTERTPYSATNDFLRTRFINIKDALNEDKDFTQNINEKIIEINSILKTGNKHFGYRVRDEIIFYMIENKLSDLLSEDEAFDFQIMQKILPTISGSDLRIKDILINLYNYCNPSNQILNDINYISEAEKGLDSAMYKKSAEKIIMMLRGYEDGFTSFWL